MRLAATGFGLGFGLGFGAGQIGNSQLPTAYILYKSGSESDRWNIWVF